MVQLMIKMPEEEGDCQEWAMIDLQGNLETRNPVPLSGKFIGDLHFAKNKDSPVLIIGHHILIGKVVELEKPFAVLEKQQKVHDGTSDMADTENQTETEYLVKAVIKKRILFKQRPKPIIANVPKKL